MSGPASAEWTDARGRRERRGMVSDGDILQWLATSGLRKREVGMACGPSEISDMEHMSGCARFTV